MCNFIFESQSHKEEKAVDDQNDVLAKALLDGAEGVQNIVSSVQVSLWCIRKIYPTNEEKDTHMKDDSRSNSRAGQKACSGELGQEITETIWIHVDLQLTASFVVIMPE